MNPSRCGPFATPNPEAVGPYPCSSVFWGSPMSEDTCVRCNGTGKNSGGRRCGRCGGDGRDLVIQIDKGPGKGEGSINVTEVWRRATRAEAENKRLRAALDEIVDDLSVPSRPAAWAAHALQVAQGALGGSQAKGSE